MAKKKSQKKFSSSTENPFNIKINRKKHSIIGQNVKGTRGRPGVSHAVGNAKRKEEFHKKKLQHQKANQFLDKRLLDNSQTYEDPATARLVQERKKKLRKSIFNLNDEESLTHKGIPLVNSNLKNEAIIDSDEDEPLDSQYLKQAHFGGFSNKSGEKSRQEIIDELIFESIKKKQQRKVAKELNENLIEKLDQEWKERHAAAFPIMKAGKGKDVNVLEENDPFDILLNELKFEKRTTPSSRLKTQEEIDEEEYEKRKQLNDERNKRMNPMDYNKEDTNNQLSADSIYDGLDIEMEPIEDNAHDNLNWSMNANVGDDSDADFSDDSKNEFDESRKMKDNEFEVTEDDASVLPDSLETFCNIVDGHDTYDVVEKLLRDIIKNKTKKNRKKLENFFAILIEYVMKASENPTNALKILDNVVPHLYALAEISPLHTASKLLFFLDKEQENFQSNKGKKKKKNFPRFQCLILFKICSKIYSVSDFKHPVGTPSMIFMCDILSSPYAISYENVMYRLFICRNIYDCVSYSKRYVPEVFFLLHKTLELAFEKSKYFNLCVDEEVVLENKTELTFKARDSLCNESKISIISEILNLLSHYAILYTDLLSYKEIFSPVLQISKKLPVNYYPDFLKQEIANFTETINIIKKTYIPLTYENKKPVPLKLFEPCFDTKFTRKKDNIKKKRTMVKSVAQKIRKEEKGIVREKRRENQVIASEKLRERIEADEDRKRKVKQLYHELSMQEGEYKKFVKKK